MKKLISWTLRHIPRPVLQRITPLAMPLVRMLRRGNAVECPVCKSTFSSFLPYGRLEARPNALCPDCLALERHRLMWLYLERKTNFFTPGHRILHIAPEHCFIQRFEKVHKDHYITADLVSPLAKVKMDVHKIPFEDNSFDIVFCNHVLEHVDDDIKAMSEIRRVLKPGGWSILQSPIDERLEATFSDPSIVSAADREKAYGQDDHQRSYGKDYAKRINQSGLIAEENLFVQTLSTEEVKRFALPLNEVLFLGRKSV